MELTKSRNASHQLSIEQALARMPIFSGMDASHLRILSAAAIRIEFRAGQMIFRQGEPANRFFVIENGKVGLISEAQGETSRFAILGSDEVLGWSWLFPPHAWNFTARAIVPTGAIFFHGTQIREACDADHDLGYDLMKRFSAVMVQRLQSSRAELIQARRDICRLSSDTESV
jgi:CRP/FNR family transcriptional regulator, cyclic AMP receptor protein